MAGSTRIDELRQKFHETPRRYFAPLANEYRKAGDPEQAIAICRAHLAQQPAHMSGHVVYGQALYDAHRTEEARGVFEKALALDPDNAVVLRQLGDIARERGETDEAKHWYSRALDADPSDKDVAAYIAELTEPVTETAAVSEAQPEPEPAAAPEPEEVEAPITPEIAPLEIEFAAEAPASVEEEREVEIAPAHEPEVEEVGAAAPEMEKESPAPAEEDVAWRATPPHEESPFVTRTMAELYAKQGYREAALDVYRQLALHHPDDKEIFDRIEALEQDSSAQTPPAAIPAGSTEPEAKPKLSEMPFEPIISDIASLPEPEVVKDYSDRAVYGAEPDEDEEFTPPPEAPHFTEMELGGDTWDTDAWGAGFSPEDEVEVEFDSPDVVEPEPQAVAPREPEPERPEPEKLEPQKPEPVEETPEPILPQVAQLDPEPVDIEPEPEIMSTPGIEPEPIAAAPVEPEPIAEEPVEPEPAFVAYSPQPPRDEELPHFAPKAPTVREFFAALGAFRPSAREGSSITAHAAMPSAPEPAADFPLATDAFSSLFGDSPVSEDDSRAAFALSGALATSQPAPVAPTPAKPAPPVEAPAPTPTAQESEEDIRRFREWLDGLQES